MMRNEAKDHPMTDPPAIDFLELVELEHDRARTYRSRRERLMDDLMATLEPIRSLTPRDGRENAEWFIERYDQTIQIVVWTGRECSMARSLASIRATVCFGGEASSPSLQIGRQPSRTVPYHDIIRELALWVASHSLPAEPPTEDAPS